MCRGVAVEGALVLAERLRRVIEGGAFEHEGATIPVTVSIGVAGYPGVDTDKSAALIAAADEALYAAKRAGRNRVIGHGRTSL